MNFEPNIRNAQVPILYGEIDKLVQAFFSGSVGIGDLKTNRRSEFYIETTN